MFKYLVILMLLIFSGCATKEVKVPIEVKVPVAKKCNYVLPKAIEIDGDDMISLVKNITKIVESEAKIRADVKKLPCLKVVEPKD